MKTTFLIAVALAAAAPFAIAADEPKADKNIIQKTGDTLKKAGDKAVDLVTTSEEEKKADAKADAAKKSVDHKADHMKNDAKADAVKKAADDKADAAKKAK